MAKAKTDQSVEQTEGGTSNALAQQSTPIAESDVARRAYDRYLARGCEPGHDLEDWLQAERELQGDVTSAGA